MDEGPTDGVRAGMKCGLAGHFQQAARGLGEVIASFASALLRPGYVPPAGGNSLGSIHSMFSSSEALRTHPCRPAVEGGIASAQGGDGLFRRRLVMRVPVGTWEAR